MSVSSGRSSSGGAAGRTRSSARSSSKSAKSSSGAAARKRSGAKQSASGRSSGSPKTTARQSASRSQSASRRQGSNRQTTAGGTANGRSASARNTARQATRNGSSATRSASQNGSGAVHSGRRAIARIGVPAVTGAVGIAGGVLLGRTALQRNRKMLGIPVPAKVDLAGVTKEIGEAGRQFGRLAGEIRNVALEVRSVRDKAEQIGKALG
jgi:hypothetical protein